MRVRRVVAGPHGIDVVLLHQHDVVEHRLLRERSTAIWIELMPVDAVELHPLTVDRKDAIDDGHSPEADRKLDSLVLRRQRSAIQPRRLRRPRLNPVEPYLLARRAIEAELVDG